MLNIENELFNVRTNLADAKYKAKIDTYTLLANAGILSCYLDKTSIGNCHA